MTYGTTAWTGRGNRMTQTTTTSEPDPEMELLPDENPDLKAEILEWIGEEWLCTPNSWFSGRPPSELLGTAEEPLLRDRVRSIKSAEFT